MCAFDGLIGFMVVWYVLWWGFVGSINFRSCFSFLVLFWWCGCGFRLVIWLWFWWLGVVVLGGGDSGRDCCGYFSALFLLLPCFQFSVTHAFMPSLSHSPSQLKSTFSPYLVLLSPFRLACGGWVGFWLDLRWFDHIYGGLICASMGLWGVIDFCICFSFLGC